MANALKQRRRYENLHTNGNRLLQRQPASAREHVDKSSLATGNKTDIPHCVCTMNVTAILGGDVHSICHIHSTRTCGDLDVPYGLQDPMPTRVPPTARYREPCRLCTLME